jgi:predicted nucleic acid-binding protein
MKALVFDAGPIISLTTNNLLFLLERLKQKFKGQFIVVGGVKRELVDKPLQTRRFKLEALQVQSLIEKKTLTVLEEEKIRSLANKLLDLANNILFAHNHAINIVQRGEIESIACALLYEADAVVADERITRTLIENPEGLQRLLEKRLHQPLRLNKAALHQFLELTRHIRIIRSIELITIAFEMGLMNELVVGIPNARRELLESALWGAKMNGCSVSEEEINKIIKMQKI